ncbi:MAG: hypothetical protein WC554_10925 [Clostridia bacterium]
MGWDGIESKASFDEVFKDEFKKSFSDGSFIKYVELKVDNLENSFLRHLNSHYEILEMSEFFVAANLEPGLIGCFIMFFERVSLDGIEYVFHKDFHESEGPFTVNYCPKEILELLSPVEKYKELWQQKDIRKWRTIQTTADFINPN